MWFYHRFCPGTPAKVNSLKGGKRDSNSPGQDLWIEQFSKVNYAIQE